MSSRKEPQMEGKVGNVLAPGMTQVIEAGEKWEIEGSDGQSFEVKAVDSADVMDFLKAFDTWLTTYNAHVTGIVLEAAQADCIKKFNVLPMRIQQEMPSFAQLGIRLGHPH